MIRGSKTKHYSNNQECAYLALDECNRKEKDGICTALTLIRR